MALSRRLRNRFRDDCATRRNTSSIMLFQPPSIMRLGSTRIRFD
jgi:hypothetical protein